MSTNSSQEIYNYSPGKNPEKSNEKFNSKIKVGKDIYIYRTLYLIAKEDLIKNKSKKHINFYLKSQIRQKSLLNLSKPKEKDIIIEDIRNLIELILSLCILNNSSNYRISLFTSSFENVQNNFQLLKYPGKVLYAKINEIKNIDNNGENKIMQTFYNEQKINNFRRLDNKINKAKTIKEFPSINLKSVFQNRKYEFSKLEDNNKISNKTNLSNLGYIKNFNTIINPKENDLIFNNDVYLNGNTNRNENSSSDKNTNIYNSLLNSQYKLGDTNRSNIFITKPIWSKTLFQKSCSNFKEDSPNTYHFPQKKLKFFKTMNRTNSQPILTKKNNFFDNNETNYINNKNLRNKTRNRTNQLEHLRFTYFSGDNKINLENNSKDFDKLKKLFAINKKYKKENVLLDLARRNKRQIQNIKLITNYLSRPSIITSKTNLFYSSRAEKFSSIRNIFFSFKNELRDLSNCLDDYISNKDLEKFIFEIDDSFKSLDFDLNYCLKEYFLYVFFDRFLKKNYPDITEKNLLYDLDITPEQIREIINSLFYLINNLKGKNKFDLVNYIRSLKSIYNCELSSDFFQIFVFCPDYFDLSKREITKKFLLLLEIDCIKNRVTIDNFINYYYIFRFSHLIQAEQKVLFINKLLHLMEAKGDLLQQKIISDIEYLFKIDNRTKQALLAKVYDLTLNFHQNIKVNEIFDSMIYYFNEPEKQNLI